MVVGEADMMALPFDDEQFDVVLMNSVLYFAKDKRQAMGEVY